MTTPSAPHGLPLVGLFLPVLAGGNVFFVLDPEPALAVLSVLTVGVAVLWIAVSPRENRGTPVAAYVALFVLLVVWLANLAFRPSGPHAAIVAQGLLLASLQFVVFRTRPLTTSELQSLFAGLAVGTLVTTAYGQYQYWEAFPRIEPIIRATGLQPILSVNANFYNANCYAPFVAAVVILVVSLLFESSATGTRLLAVVALPLLLATLGLTGSRSTIALLIVVGVLALARRADARLRAPTVWALAIIGFVALLVAAWFSELVQVGFLGRLRIWQAALRMIADNWTTGVGLGGFAEAFPRYRLDDYFTRYPHNLWLEVFAEMGIVAAVALATFLFATASAAAAAARATSPFRAAAAVASLLMIAHALLDIDWEAPANPILLFLLLAIAGAGEPTPARAERVTA